MLCLLDITQASGNRVGNNFVSSRYWRQLEKSVGGKKKKDYQERAQAINGKIIFSWGSMIPQTPGIKSVDFTRLGMPFIKGYSAVSLTSALVANYCKNLLSSQSCSTPTACLLFTYANAIVPGIELYYEKWPAFEKKYLFSVYCLTCSVMQTCKYLF